MTSPGAAQRIGDMVDRAAGKARAGEAVRQMIAGGPDADVVAALGRGLVDAQMIRTGGQTWRPGDRVTWNGAAAMFLRYDEGWPRIRLKFSGREETVRPSEVNRG